MSQVLSEFDPQSEDFARDPYSVYAALRRCEGPVFHHPTGAWLFSRFADVEAVALDKRMVRSREAFMPPAQVEAARRVAGWHEMPEHQRYVQVSLLDSDGPAHARLRRLVLGEFTRSFTERHRPMIEAFVNRTLDELLDRGEIDFTADLAARVPGHVIGMVLGVPEQDCPQLRIWSDDVVRFFDVGRNSDDKARAEQATADFAAYLRDLIAERKNQPRADLVSTLVAAQQAGRLDETELISLCMLILMAGHGSTIDVLGSGMNALLRHPAQEARLRRKPGLMPHAVQEMFRYDSPLPFFHRYAAEDLELSGRRFPKGTRFGLLYGAANRDPARFSQPDVFDVGREPNRHIAFGRGPHLCLGNSLSRLDMEVVFIALLRRTRRIELMEAETVFRRGLSVRGPVALPVRLVPA